MGIGATNNKNYHSRLLDKLRHIPSYGNSIQNKLSKVL